MTKDASTLIASSGSFTVEQLESLVRERFGAAVRDDVGAVAYALSQLIADGRAEHTEAWVDDADLATHALHHATDSDADPRSVIASLRGGDLMLALACARGVDGALRYFERQHLAHVSSFVSRIDSSPSFADEVRQRLRSRLLTGSADKPPQILGYSGRAQIGGWLRVCAIREARAIAADARRQVALARGMDTDKTDPELVMMKDKYAGAVSEAFRDALDALAPDDRTILRLHYLDGLTIEEVGALYEMSRATAARVMSRARQRLVDGVRAVLARGLGIGRREADSLLVLVRSRIDFGLGDPLH